MAVVRTGKITSKGDPIYKAASSNITFVGPMRQESPKNPMMNRVGTAISGAYSTVDRRVFGGLLPGGVNLKQEVRRQQAYQNMNANKAVLTGISERKRQLSLERSMQNGQKIVPNDNVIAPNAISQKPIITDREVYDTRIKRTPIKQNNPYVIDMTRE